MKVCHIFESTGESAKIADSCRKGIIACEQSTVWYKQIYKLIRPNLLSLIVGFDRIDVSHDKDNKSNLQSKQIYSHLTESWRHNVGVEVRSIGYLADAGIANS